MRKLCVLLLAGLILGTVARASEGFAISQINLSASDADGFSSAEMPLGSFAADALRGVTGADIAIFCSGDLGVNLQAGEITDAELEQSFPHDRKIAVAAVSPAQLYALLETLVSRVTTGEDERIDHAASEYDGFPQVSGFSFRYDAAAPAGDRLLSVTQGGVTLDAGDEAFSLTLAGSLLLLAGGYGGEDLTGGDAEVHGSLREIIKERLTELGTLTTAPDTGRIEAIGAREGGLIERYPLGILAVVVVLFAVSRGRRFTRKADRSR